MMSRLNDRANENDVSVTEPWYIANSQPETPASADAMPNTATLVRARLTPQALAATGSSRRAAIDRPKRERTSSDEPTSVSTTKTQTTTKNRCGSPRSREPIVSGGTPYQPSGSTVRPSSVNTSPNASVTSAR